MRATRTIGAFFLFVVVGSPNRSMAFVDTTASWFVSAGAQARDFHRLDTQTVSDHGASMTIADVDNSYFATAKGDFGGFAYVSGSLQARARVGALRASLEFDLYAETELAGIGFSDIASANVGRATASASWRDSATITVPGLPQGFPLLVPAGIDVTGAFRTSFPDVQASGCCGGGKTEVSIHAIDGTLIDSGSSLHNLPALDGDSDLDLPGGSHFELLQFENGVPHDIGFVLEVTATGYADRGPVSVFQGFVQTRLLADYSNTLTWGGITGVLNAETGEPVENWTITSESGFDYSRPYQIPEPATSLLLVTALAGLSTVASGRRRS